jgi:hypothetical protein
MWLHTGAIHCLFVLLFLHVVATDVERLAGWLRLGHSKLAPFGLRGSWGGGQSEAVLLLLLLQVSFSLSAG